MSRPWDYTVEYDLCIGGGEWVKGSHTVVNLQGAPKSRGQEQADTRRLVLQGVLSPGADLRIRKMRIWAHHDHADEVHIVVPIWGEKGVFVGWRAGCGLEARSLNYDQGTYEFCEDCLDWSYGRL